MSFLCITKLFSELPPALSSAPGEEDDSGLQITGLKAWATRGSWDWCQEVLFAPQPHC